MTNYYFCSSKNKVCNFKTAILIVFGVFILSGCKKNWLNVRNNKSVVIPSTITDYQALLDAYPIMHANSYRLQDLIEIGTDGFSLSDVNWVALTGFSKPAYIFDKDIWQGAKEVAAWNGTYKRIFLCNMALDGLAQINININDSTEWKTTRGNALFIRAHNYFWLMQAFGAPYHPETATQKLGVPMRLTSDINEKSVRGTVKQCYDQILRDAEEALSLLPENGINLTRPSRQGCLALKSRILLMLDDLKGAENAALSALNINNAVLDYNSLNSSLTYPVTQYNIETVYSDFYGSTVFATSRCRVDSLLYNSYNQNDLRKSIYFKKQTAGHYSFNGSYNGNSNFFCGIARDEIYFILAESLARQGKTAEALNYLNSLLVTRWKTGSYINFQASTKEEAIKIILEERRKSLLFRGLRWYDLRRLNSLYNAGIFVTHVVEGKTYTLEPNSTRYLMPIPDDIISMTGMPQNQR